MSNQSKDQALLRLADERKVDNRLIVAFCDSNYLDVLLNWLIGIHRLAISNYLVVSLDATLHEFLTRRGFPSFRSDWQGPLLELWRRRLAIIRELCRHGVDVIHSDPDAIWLRNPIGDYFAGQADHLVASQGTVWPEDIVRKQGFVLCCGLFFIRSTPETITLLDDLLAGIAEAGDDQTILNRILGASVVWDVKVEGRYEIQFMEHRILCSQRTIRGFSRDRGIGVAMLPHHLFQRIHMPQYPAYVKHLVSKKTGGDKLDSFRQSESLFLRHDWKSIAFDRETIGRIDIGANKAGNR